MSVIALSQVAMLTALTMAGWPAELHTQALNVFLLRVAIQRIRREREGSVWRLVWTRAD